MFNINTFDIQKFDTILNKGLSKGLGKTDTQMCIEAAICQTLGLPHGDDPKCVTESVRAFKIRLNDSNWSSPEARAKGLRNLGLAQLGSLGVVRNIEFSEKITLLTIQQLIPTLFREVFPDNKECQDTADQCELAADIVVAANARAAAAARAARAAAYTAARARAAAAAAARAAAAAAAAYADDAGAVAARAANAAAYAAARAAAAAAAAAADDAGAVAAAYAAYAADDAGAVAAAAAAYAAAAAAARVNNVADPDKYLIMSANFALQVLKELNSPGCKLLDT